MFVSDPIYKMKALLIYLMKMRKCKYIPVCVVWTRTYFTSHFLTFKEP